ncbi:hypothetical protein PVAND_009294 [Polypedilum vanderplanki]|uniref:Protein sarah n=1 Tax=Polypedilum vanderplanki TaxID=319348 RepID=A0A9J6CCH0_POLVA|nr:hypothetical protein PVAND_009294 [Polypedilum vanderplanki]
MENESEYFVNQVDGLPNDHPALPLECDVSESTEIDPESLDDLPTSLIVTNIHSEVFHSDELKAEIENVFREFSDEVTFQWLKSFRRLRVNYDNALSAANARIRLHQYRVNKSVINCYFAQPVTPISNKSLQPPAPSKQFLISPPSSPPAGWAQAEECEPFIFNHDLLAALANLNPGEVHEIHAASETQPGIMVHTAIVAQDSSSTDESDDGKKGKVSIAHTRCPERT